MTECNSQLDLFSIGRRSVTASFDDVRLTSDSGVTFLHQVDNRLALTERLAAAMVDRRDPARVLEALSFCRAAAVRLSAGVCIHTTLPSSFRQYGEEQVGRTAPQ